MDGEDKISGLYVKVAKGADVEKITKNIENKYNKNISTISSISDMESNKEVIDMLNGVKGGIFLLAILVGGIKIINTMIMSVFERIREIGVLKSVGWSNRRIIGMIVGEAVVITLIVGIIGGLYPAIKASKLPPTEALRYE